MALTLGTAPGDTLQSLSSYLATNANALSAASDQFIAQLLEERDEAFNIELPENLNYLQWDYDTELAQLMALRPGGVVLDLTGTDADIDRLNAEVTPTSPVLDLPTAAIPSLDAERPQLTLPVAPGTDVGLAPQDAPALEDIVAPEAPVVALPAVPTFEELQLPVAPSFSLPTFEASAPQNLLAPPTNAFAYVDAGYTSALRDPVTAKLLFDLENGGYGIEPADEDALWGRARDRAEQQGRLAVEEAMKRAAQTSFPMPQGALYAELERARAASQLALSEANRDIALKRADMYVENRRFTITEVRQLEALSIALYNAIQERALNFAKAVADVGIAVYDASVRNFNSQLDAYKTEAQVFEVRIRAELGKAELFKAQIEAENLRGQFNAQRVQLYQAQLNGVQSVVNLYKTRVEATSALTDIQRQKIEVFKARIQAYGERVRAKASEYEMYKAGVQGETAKLEIYRTDIAAHETRLRGEELRVRTLLQANEARIQNYRSQVAEYASRLDALSKSSSARLEQQQTLVQAASVNVQGYRALADAVLSGVETRARGQKMNNEWNIAAMNSRVKTAEMLLEQQRLAVTHRTEIDKFGAKFYGDPLTATLASLNGLSVKAT